MDSDEAVRMTFAELRARVLATNRAMQEARDARDDKKLEGLREENNRVLEELLKKEPRTRAELSEKHGALVQAMHYQNETIRKTIAQEIEKLVDQANKADAF